MSAKALGAALAVLLIASCSKPEAMEQFVKASDAKGGVYEFCLDFSDSLALYDVSIWSAVNATFKQLSSLKPVQLDIKWLTPRDSTALEETVFLNFGKDGVAKSEYRTGINPGERGEWKIKISVPVPPKGLRGMGTICTRKDGTR